VDTLFFVEEEDGEGCGGDDFFDLVFALGEEAGLFVEAMGFVDDEGLESVFRGGHERAGADEEAGDAGLVQGSGELALVDRSRGGVFRNVLGDVSATGEFDEEIDRDDGLARAGTAVDDEHVFVGRSGGLGEKLGRFVDELLVVDHVKLLIALE
jgi:hypothetical protein